MTDALSTALDLLHQVRARLKQHWHAIPPDVLDVDYDVLCAIHAIERAQIMTPSKRQRRQLKRWHKGKLIKCRELDEFRRLGWIDYMQGNEPGLGYVAAPYLTDAGRAVIGGEASTS